MGQKKVDDEGKAGHGDQIDGRDRPSRRGSSQAGTTGACLSSWASRQAEGREGETVTTRTTKKLNPERDLSRSQPGRPDEVSQRPSCPSRALKIECARKSEVSPAQAPLRGIGGQADRRMLIHTCMWCSWLC